MQTSQHFFSGAAVCIKAYGKFLSKSIIRLIIIINNRNKKRGEISPSSDEFHALGHVVVIAAPHSSVRDSQKSTLALWQVAKAFFCAFMGNNTVQSGFNFAHCVDV